MLHNVKCYVAHTHVCFVSAVEDVFGLNSTAFDAILNAARCFKGVSRRQLS